MDVEAQLQEIERRMADTFACGNCGMQGLRPGMKHGCFTGGVVPEYTLPDSGERRHFDTGSQRDSRKGKGRFDLLPPLAMARVAEHFERGAEKYEERNWEKGQSLGDYFDSGMRHLYRYMYWGADQEDHLVAAAWNILCAIETRERVRLGHLPSVLENIPPNPPHTKA